LRSGCYTFVQAVMRFEEKAQHPEDGTEYLGV
jgi:hypothetical protein